MSWPHIDTKEDFQRFQDAFQHFFEDQEIDGWSLGEEEEFSGRACDCCERQLGGHRWTAHPYVAGSDNTLDPIRVCDDCAYFEQYGELDDETMLRLTLPQVE